MRTGEHRARWRIQVLQIQQMVTGGQGTDCSCGLACRQLHKGRQGGRVPRNLGDVESLHPDAVAGHCQEGMVSAGRSAGQQPRNTNVQGSHDLGTTGPRGLVYCQWGFWSLENPWLTRNNMDCSYPRTRNWVMGGLVFKKSHNGHDVRWALASPVERGIHSDGGMRARSWTETRILHLACVLFILNLANIYIFSWKK